MILNIFDISWNGAKAEVNRRRTGILGFEH
jgi:hypothetical protein